MIEAADIIATERRLWGNDPTFYADTFAPDAVLIFHETGPLARDVAVAAIREENGDGRAWAEVEFVAPVVQEIAPNVLLLTYESIARWNYEPVAQRSFCSSLYVRRDGRWRVLLHQQTPRR